MENAAEALKIAFAVILFVLALTLSISSFSRANETIQEITTLRDRESKYTYVTPTENLSRTVGIETVVSTIYKSNVENIRIYFMKKNGNKNEPMPICYATKANGDLIKDDLGNKIEISYIDLSTGYGKQEAPIDFFDVLLGGKNVPDNDVYEKYKNRLLPSYKENGLYDVFANYKFTEVLGEYEEGSGASKITKRIITYIKQ